MESHNLRLNKDRSNEPYVARPIFDSHSYQQYQRQRQLTLGDLLLENRIVFLQGEIYTAMPTKWS